LQTRPAALQEKSTREYDESGNRLRIVYSNTDSVGNKWAEIKCLSVGIDILAFTETWLRPDISVETLIPGGFVTYRADRKDGRIGGGVMLMVAEHHLQSPGGEFATPNIQIIYMEIKSRKDPMTIVLVYRSPSATINEDIGLIDFLSGLVRANGNILIMGDFNAPHIKWKDDDTEAGGFDRIFLDFIHQFALMQHVDQPTRLRGVQKASILDLVLTKSENQVAQLQSDVPIGKSDHTVLKLEINLRLPPPPDKIRRNYGRINQKDLVRRAAQLTWKRASIHESIEHQWSRFKRNILTLTDQVAPLRTVKRKGKPPWWKNFLDKKLKMKRKAWARYRTSGSHRRHREYIKARKAMIQSISQTKKDYEVHLAGRSKVNPKAFFNYAQSKRTLRKGIGQIVDLCGITRTEDGDKAMALAEHFHKVHRKDAKSVPPTFSVDLVESQKMNNIIIKAGDVEKRVSKLKVAKANGPDEIHPAVLKNIASIVAAPLADLFNQSIVESSLPEDWKKATVVPIHKGGRADGVGNYRPVSLTSVVLKLMEGLVRDEIAGHMVGHHLMSAKQHGFVKGRSCLTNLLLFLDEITSRLDKGEKVEVCYLDFQKAFDSVNHRFLLLKLRAYKISEEICRWIEQFLYKQTFAVAIGQSKSPEMEISSGVPQGSVLGPILFLIFINDLAHQIRNPSYLFADDLKIVGNPGDSLMQNDLEVLMKWTQDWDLPLNEGKCCQLLRAEAGNMERHLGGSGNGILNRVDTIKDLGIMVNADFQFSDNCTQAAKKARRAFYQLKRTVSSRDPMVFVPLYKAIVRPHLEYCVQAWSPNLEKDKKKLEAVQRLATRSVKGMKGKSYEDRLRHLNLFSLDRRRLRGDLIEAYKMLQGNDAELQALLPRSNHTTLRGNQLKLAKPRVVTNVRKHFFASRVVNTWNKLPNNVIMSSSVETFKRELDRIWSKTFPELV
jgi:hypothetical protein